MAENNEKLDIPDGKKSKKKLIIIALIVLLLLGGGGAGAYFFLFSAPEEETLLTEEEITPVVNREPASYVILPRPFVFNLTGDAKRRMAQVRVQLMVRGVDNEALAKQNLPLIQNELLTVFGSADYNTLITANGRIKLRDQATKAVQDALKEIEQKEVVERVLFTDFVIQ